ncbi:MAG: acyl-CoA dehydrogenase family protein [Ignavibacteriaceae bacterium]|nr:acyl-CoA dehydrogenase family protein [Ignavibacteriaceae bacterium]
MPVYKGIYYFETDSLLSDEEKMIRDKVREFVPNEIIPVTKKHNRKVSFPFEVIRKMADLDLFRLILPQKNNCDKVNNVVYGSLIQEPERMDSSISSCGISGGYPVMRHAANLESVNIYEGTHEMYNFIIGEDITGYSAFK